MSMIRQCFKETM